MLHRPGNELKRLTPRNNDRLLFDGIPWVAPRPDERLTRSPSGSGTTQRQLHPDRAAHRDALHDDDARNHAITTGLAGLHLGDTLRGYLARFLREALARADRLPTAGIRNDEVRSGFRLVTSLLASDDFLVDPLPNLLFTRDSSVWVGDRWP